MRNVMALNIPADYLRKIFLSHLHTDHWGDLDSLWAGGWTGGRTGPLEVWGPNGAREDMGTKYAIDGFMCAYNWDYVTRDGILERMAVSVDDAWDVAGPTPPPGPDKKFPPQESEFTLNGRWEPAVEVDNEAFKGFRKKHGLK